jgi:hypothetical protein
VAKERTMRHAHAIAKPRQATSALGSIGTRSRRTRNQEKQRRPRDLATLHGAALTQSRGVGFKAGLPKEMKRQRGRHRGNERIAIGRV